MEKTLLTLLANPDSALFWAAIQEGRFLVQRCNACSAWRYYPRHVCPECLSLSFRWEPSAGSGEVYAVTTVHRAPAGFDLAPPYQVALITLHEGVRILATIHAECRVRIGDKVVLRFRTSSAGVRMPEFAKAT